MMKSSAAVVLTGALLASLCVSTSSADDPLGYQSRQGRGGATGAADPLGYQARLRRSNAQPSSIIQYGIPHARYYEGRYLPNQPPGPRYVPQPYTPPTPSVLPTGNPFGLQPAYVIQRFGNQFRYVPNPYFYQSPRYFYSRRR